MRTPQLATRSVRLLAVSLLLAGVAAAVSPPATAARTGSPGPAASFTVRGAVGGVAAVSARDAWAVGFAGNPHSHKTLIGRWNGKTWKRVPSPSPGAEAGLNGVAATSASSAWAVGCTNCLTNASGKTLILRWNGKTWK